MLNENNSIWQVFHTQAKTCPLRPTPEKFRVLYEAYLFIFQQPRYRLIALISRKEADFVLPRARIEHEPPPHERLPSILLFCAYLLQTQKRPLSVEVAFVCKQERNFLTFGD